jgi:hypothetical protein
MKVVKITLLLPNEDIKASQKVVIGTVIYYAIFLSADSVN